MKITVEQVGNPKFPRYVMALENGCFFDGTGWTPDKKKALKFASLPVIKEDWKKLQKEMENGLIELVGTVVVRIAGKRELTASLIAKLGRYLAAASTFTLDYTQQRPACLKDLVISTQIHWNLKPKK